MRGKGLYVILTDSGPHLGATHNFGYANEIQLLNEELLQTALCLRRGFSCDYTLKFPICWSWSVLFFVSCWHWKSSFWPYRVKRPHMVLIKARCRSWWSGWTSRCRKQCCFSEVQDPRVLHCTCVTDLTAKAWVVSRFLFHRLPLAEALLWFGFPAANRHWSVLEVVLELNLPSKFHVFHCVSKLNFCFYSL